MARSRRIWVIGSPARNRVSRAWPLASLNAPWRMNAPRRRAAASSAAKPGSARSQAWTLA